jgi:hypothetical protein
MVKNEMGAREFMIERIEGFVGCYEAIWNDWPTTQIWKMYMFCMCNG